MICLTTSRLRIRDHKPSDLQSHHALMSNLKIMWFLQDTMTHNLDESRENLRRAIDAAGLVDRKEYFLRIEDRLTDEHIGEIGYTVVRVTPVGKLVIVGYFIHDVHWGRGYTPEAFSEVIRFAFEEDGVYRITCGCLKENVASERVMRKCGLIKEAEFKECQWHDGKMKDRVQYRLLRAEWKAS